MKRQGKSRSSRAVPVLSARICAIGWPTKARVSSSSTICRPAASTILRPLDRGLARVRRARRGRRTADRDSGHAVHPHLSISPARHRPTDYQADPEHTLLTNVVGHAPQLASCRAKRGAVAAHLDQRSLRRPRNPPAARRVSRCGELHGPRACYDEGKRAAEALAFDFLRLGRADVRVARIFNTYGPRMRPTTAASFRTSSASCSPARR